MHNRVSRSSTSKMGAALMGATFSALKQGKNCGVIGRVVINHATQHNIPVPKVPTLCKKG